MRPENQDFYPDAEFRQIRENNRDLEDIGM